jgi:hypothetical protein
LGESNLIESEFLGPKSLSGKLIESWTLTLERLDSRVEITAKILVASLESSLDTLISRHISNQFSILEPRGIRTASANRSTRSINEGVDKEEEKKTGGRRTTSMPVRETGRNTVIETGSIAEHVGLRAQPETDACNRASPRQPVLAGWREVKGL